MCNRTTFWSKTCRNTKVQISNGRHTTGGSSCFRLNDVPDGGTRRLDRVFLLRTRSVSSGTRLDGADQCKVNMVLSWFSSRDHGVQTLALIQGGSSFPFLHTSTCVAFNIRGHEGYIYVHIYQYDIFATLGGVPILVCMRNLVLNFKDKGNCDASLEKDTTSILVKKMNGYERQWLSASLIQFAASIAKPF